MYSGQKTIGEYKDMKNFFVCLFAKLQYKIWQCAMNINVFLNVKLRLRFTRVLYLTSLEFFRKVCMSDFRLRIYLIQHTPPIIIIENGCKLLSSLISII